MPEPATAVAPSTSPSTSPSETALPASAAEGSPAAALLAPALASPLPDPGAALAHASIQEAVDWAAQADLFEREARQGEAGRPAAELLLEAGRLRAEHLDDRTRAEALWRAAAEADPTFGPAALVTAQAEAERARAEGRHDDRVRALERCAEVADAATGAALLAAASAVAEERLERPSLAADLALRAFELAPADAALRREARRHAEREERDASLARILEAEAADEATTPRDAGLALCALSRLLSGPLDDPGEARARLEQARRRSADDPLVLDTAAALHEERGEWDLAAEALRARVAAQDAGAPGEVVELVAGHLRLAEICAERLGRPAEAIERYREALALDPALCAARHGLERLYEAASRHADLAALLEEDLARAGTADERIATLLRLARLQEDRLADPRAASITLERILRLDATHLPALRALERIYAGSGQWTELVRTCRAEAEVTSAPEAAAELHFTAAEILARRLGDVDGALAGYREVLTLAPAHLGALAALARLERARGAWESLIEVLLAQAAVRGSPDRRAAIFCEVAELWETRLGDPGRAIEVHLEALAEVPGFGPSLRALDRLLAARARHDELAALLRAQGEAASGPTRTAALVRAARLAAERLGDRAAALEACRAALATAPDDRSARQLLEELLGGWSAAQARDSTAAGDAAAGTTTRLRLAEAHEAAGRLAEAAEVLRRALVAAPGSLPTVRALARVAARSGALTEARNALRSQAALLQDDAAAAAALTQAGELSRRLSDAVGAAADWAAALARSPQDAAVAARLAAVLGELPDPGELLGGPERALDAVDAALAAAPELPDGLRLRARLLAGAGRYADAARDLTCLLGLGVEAVSNAPLHLELATLYDGPLGDPARAVSHLQAAVAAAPEELAPLERLAALHQQAENWPAAADALRRLLNLPALPAQARCRTLLALAEIRAAAFGDRAAALELCEEARRLAPDDAAVAAALERHQANAGGGATPAMAEAAAAPAAAPAIAAASSTDGALVAEQRRLLCDDPARAETWRALFRQFRSSGAVDHAFVAAGVLRFLGASDPQEDGALHAEKAIGASPAAGHRLDDVEWLLLRHPGDRGPLSEILALAGDALCEVAQLPAPAREPESAAQPLVELVREACAVLGLRPFPLRSGGEGSSLTLVPGDPVVVYAGAELVRRRTLSEQRFLVARAAAQVRIRSALAGRLPAPALRGLLAATIRLVAPDEVGLGVPPEALARAVARAIPRKIRKALGEPVRALEVSGVPDFRAWQASLAASADRVGLLLCGDVPAALELVLAEHGPVPTGPPALAAAARQRAPLRDLLLFAASDDHFMLRRRLGLAVE